MVGEMDSREQAKVQDNIEPDLLIKSSLPRGERWGHLGEKSGRSEAHASFLWWNKAWHCSGLKNLSAVNTQSEWKRSCRP